MLVERTLPLSSKLLGLVNASLITEQCACIIRQKDFFFLSLFCLYIMANISEWFSCFYIELLNVTDSMYFTLHLYIVTIQL